MLETELFALLEHTADAAYSVTNEGEIRSWNHAAERLIGYPSSLVVGRNIDDVLQARDSLGTDALAGGLEAATRRWDGTGDGIANFDLEIGTRTGQRIWVNVSTIIFDNQRTGHRLFVRLVRDMNQRRRTERLFSGMVDLARQVLALSEASSEHAPVEPLSEQERRILSLFAAGRNSAAIGRELEISPHTLRNHLHHINRKLRTHSRLEAVTHAQRRGLLD
jgi:PAS domain S-box-containing protein